jgi:uncharacterized membrane protein YphA (DoxX/SURF4 family)
MKRSRWLTVLRVAAAVAIALLVLALPGSGYRGASQPGPPSANQFTVSQIGWLILAVPLIVHGLAHLSGLIAPYTRRHVGFAERPWIFAHGVTPHSSIGRAFGLVWLAAAAALAIAGIGLLLGQAWWAALAVAASILSLAAIITWWHAVPAGAKAGAAFDLLVLLTALQPTQALLSRLAR